MKAYVHTLEAVIALILLSAAYVFAVGLLRRDPAIGTPSGSDLEDSVYSVLDYLNLKGILQNLTAHRDWATLQRRLDEMLLSIGIGYYLEVYAPDDGGNLVRTAVIISGYNDNSQSRATVYYFVYPSRSIGGETYYLFIMKVSR